MKKILFICLVVLCSLSMIACGNETKKASEAKPAVAVFKTSMGSFEVELETNLAPKTSENFINLVDKGYYNGTLFHRIIDNFMIQGGDPTGTGRGCPGSTIKDEFSSNLTPKGAGILSMANSGPNSGGSQFFITLRDCPWLDGKHAVFGKVIKGMDVVYKIGKVKTNAEDRPLEPVKIESITIVK